jgi:multidrug efflux pump subunit AcrB
MKRLVHYLIHQKLLIGLLVFLIAVLGIASMKSLNRESIPDVALDLVTITTIYPGASPNDAEELISIPIEKKLRSIDGLDKVRSYNGENISILAIYIDDKAKDKKKVVQDIKDAVDQVDNLPASAEKPVVKEITTDTTEFIYVAFTGKNANVPYAKLREFANLSEDFFYDINGVAEVEKHGYLDREYLVNVDPDALKKYRLGMNTIIATLNARNVNAPGGALRVDGKEYVLRTSGQFKNAEEIRNTVILGNDTGFATRIRDIATVTDGYEEPDTYRRFDGKPAVIFKLKKKRSADEIDIAERVRKAVAAYSLPGYEDVEIHLYNDASKMTKHRLSSVIEEAILGFITLGIFMLLLLGRRMTWLVLAGIPVSFFVTFTVMSYLDITFNIISLFGMIMVLGMIVDFSIVIAENSHRYMEHGLKRAAAVEQGVSEVFWPVTATLICIIAAFMPLLLVTGLIGKFIHAIPVVIIAALTASWAIAMFILPTYLNIFLHEEHAKAGTSETLPTRIISAVRCRFFGGKKRGEKICSDLRGEDENFEPGLFGRIQKKYKNFLRTALHHRYITVGILVVLLIISLSLAPRVGFKFMAEGGEEQIRVTVKAPHETNLNANLAEMVKLEKIVLTTPRTEMTDLDVWVGEEYAMVIDPKPGKATYKTNFDIYLCPEKDRVRTAREINLELRKKIADAQASGLLSKDISIKADLVFKGPPVGKPVNVEIKGRDYDVIKKIAKEYEDYLRTVKGVRDLSIDLEEGKLEYRYTVDEAVSAISGISTYDIAVALNASFQGAVATKVNQNQEEVGVRVRFEEDARSHMNGLHDVKIATRTGGLVSLDQVSRVKTDTAYSQINRLNFKRLVQVQADTDTKIITPMEVTKLLEKKFPDIEKRYPGYLITYGGEQEDTNKSMSELGKYFIGALLVIFVVITVFMRSLIMPVVVMIAIPFALVGVVLAQFFHHQPLSFMSMLGLFSLAGIIVSNTLVLVQFINGFRQEGRSLIDAVVEGGVVRLRPIILTAGSMVLELMPVIYGFGGKDYMVAPLAMAFGYGLIFATFITLVLIPCFYCIAEDAKSHVASFASRFGVTMSHSIYNPPVADDEDDNESAVDKKLKTKKKVAKK